MAGLAPCPPAVGAWRFAFCLFLENCCGVSGFSACSGGGAGLALTAAFCEFTRQVPRTVSHCTLHRGRPCSSPSRRHQCSPSFQSRRGETRQWLLNKTSHLLLLPRLTGSNGRCRGGRKMGCTQRRTKPSSSGSSGSSRRCSWHGRRRRRRDN